MHVNANITYQQQESEKFLQAILSVQPRIQSSVGGKSPDEQIIDLATELLEIVPEPIDTKVAAKEIMKKDSNGLLHCLTTVLLQEVEKYNLLIRKLDQTLNLIIKAVNGIVLSSTELDLMYKSLLDNQVPQNWSSIAYPSLKPLGSWIKDLNLRVEFMRNW